VTPDRPIRRRSVYADRLLEFREFTFSDGAEFTHRGAWRDHFNARIGSLFDERIIFEIGCNDAAFLTRIAQKHPTTAFVGIDWKCRALHEASARIDSSGLRNIALIHGCAQDIKRFFAGDEVNEIWLFHPDPCDKPRELANRLFAEQFLRDAHDVLRQRGLLTLKTDHADYHRDAVQLSRSLDFYDVAAVSVDFWNDEVAQLRVQARGFAGEMTSFEARFRKKRHRIGYLELRKRRADIAGAHTPCS